MDSMIQQAESVFMNTYKQLPIIIEKGEDNYLFDTEGNKYLDFVAGIATNALGYSHTGLKTAIKEQVDKFTHCSNLYFNGPAIEAASLLVALSGLDQVFFCNSGAEANEGAIKLAKRYTKLFVDSKKTKIISMKNSFHGRTIATVTMTGQTKYHEGFAPLFQGVDYVEFNNLKSLEAAMDDEVAIVIIEPIQGEGGIVPAEQSFLEGARKLCDDYGAVLIFDEVQCGIGRTGKAFAYQQYGVVPDIVSLAKGLGAGYVIGAVVANKKVAQGFVPGTHATTFGGNPLSTTAAKVILSEIKDHDLLAHVEEMSALLRRGLLQLQKKHPSIVDVRGMGLLMAMEMEGEAGPVVQEAMKHGLLLINAGVNVVRFVPPLTIQKEDIEEMLAILDQTLVCCNQ